MVAAASRDPDCRHVILGPLSWRTSALHSFNSVGTAHAEPLHSAAGPPAKGRQRMGVVCMVGILESRALVYRGLTLGVQVCKSNLACCDIFDSPVICRLIRGA